MKELAKRRAKFEADAAAAKAKRAADATEAKILREAERAEASAKKGYPPDPNADTPVGRAERKRLLDIWKWADDRQKELKAERDAKGWNKSRTSEIPQYGYVSDLEAAAATAATNTSKGNSKANTEKYRIVNTVMEDMKAAFVKEMRTKPLFATMSDAEFDALLSEKFPTL